MRDFTPRRFNRGRNTLFIDFALHNAGPAMRWAASARVGDTLEIGGPKGSAIAPDDFDWYLLIGDETALPAIGRRLEELGTDVPVTTIVVTEAGGTQQFQSKASWTPRWIARNASSTMRRCCVRRLPMTHCREGEGFVWIAAEASVARSLRTHIVDHLRHPRQWTKAAGYWKRSQAGSHEKIED